MAVLLLEPVLLSLGFWQLDRAEQKRNILATIAARADLPALSLAQLDESSTAWQHRRIYFSGHYLLGRDFLIDNQIVDGQFGYEVISLFQLNGNDGLVLVSRGWIKGSLDRDKLPSIPPVQGSVTIQAKIYLPNEKEFSLGKEQFPPEWPKRVSHISVERLQAGLSDLLLPFVARLETGEPGVLRRHWKGINIVPEKHTGYAVQWFALSLLLIVMFAFKSVRLNVHSEP